MSERERSFAAPELSRDLATGGHCRKNNPETCEASTTISPNAYRRTVNALCKRATGESCLSNNMATPTRPPILLAAYYRPGVPSRERRRRDEIHGREGASRRRDSPPPSANRRTHHRDRTTLDESEMYDDRRRLRVRDRASRGALRDCDGGGGQGGTPPPRRVKSPPSPREGGVDGATAPLPVFRSYAPGLVAREKEKGRESLVVDVGRLATMRDRPSALSAPPLLLPLVTPPWRPPRGSDTTLARLLFPPLVLVVVTVLALSARVCERRIHIRSREWERLVAIGSGILRVEGQEEDANALKDMPVMYKYISVVRVGPLKSEITKPGHRISIPIEDIDERKKRVHINYISY